MPLYQFLLASCLPWFWLCSSLPFAVMEPLPSQSIWLSLCRMQLDLSSHLCLCVLCGHFEAWRSCPVCFSSPSPISCGVKLPREKECKSRIFKMKEYFFFFPFCLIPCVSQCIWEDGWLLWSICDWLTKWGQVKSVLISRSDWTLNPFLVSFLSSTCKGTVTFKIFANEGIKMGVYSHTIMRKLQNLNCFYTTFKSQLWSNYFSIFP